MTTPKAQSSFALTVNLMSAPTVSTETPSIQNAFQVRNDDELFTPFGDETNELQLPMHADARRLLHIGARDLRNFVAPVRGHADQNRLVVDVDFDDDDARIGGILRHRHAETNAQIRERNYVAAHIDDARHK